jgi:hypothetical protein
MRRATTTTAKKMMIMTIMTMTMMTMKQQAAAFSRISMTTTKMSTSKSIIPRIKTANALVATDYPVIVKGWVRTLRKQKTLAFVEVNDGSNLAGIQCVLSFDQMDEHTMNGELRQVQLRSIELRSLLRSL